VLSNDTMLEGLARRPADIPSGRLERDQIEVRFLESDAALVTSRAIARGTRPDGSDVTNITRIATVCVRREDRCQSSLLSQCRGKKELHSPSGKRRFAATLLRGQLTPVRQPRARDARMSVRIDVSAALSWAVSDTDGGLTSVPGLRTVSEPCRRGDALIATDA
jgi:hypothetical protein